MPLTRTLDEMSVQGPGLRVRNPATGELLGTVKDYSIPDLGDILRQAHDAKTGWSRQPAKTRAEILRRWHQLILNHTDLLAAILSAESGKPVSEARAEVAYGAAFIEWFAEEGKRAYGDVIPSPAGDKRVLTLREPVGVCAAITPWNFPLAMITRKVGPALAAGCPIIVKPAEATPYTALMLERLAHQAGVPKAVFRVVTTQDPSGIGAYLCASSLVRKLSFTGSTRVGKILLAQCAATVKRVSMELGGNAPFIVFDDADLEAAVKGAAASRYRNAGQTCICANRFLVQAGIHDAFVARLTDAVRQMKCGSDAHGTEVQIGPLINSAAADKVERLVGLALNAGARVKTGGTRFPGGNYFEPTVLTGVTPDMDIVREEIFGPVAAILPFRTEAEAIALANDTPYGLAAYVYTSDLARAWRMMEAIECGMVGINESLISTELAPFGGIKESGIGREGARAGLEEYLETKYAMLGGL